MARRRQLADTPQFRLLDPAFDASQMSEPVRRVLALQNASTADATKARSRAVAAAFRQHDADCGSTREYLQYLPESVTGDRSQETVTRHGAEGEEGGQCLDELLRRESQRSWESARCTVRIESYSSACPMLCRLRFE